MARRTQWGRSKRKVLRVGVGRILLLAPEKPADAVEPARNIDALVRRRSHCAVHPVEHVGVHAAAAVYAYVDGLADRGYRWRYAPGVSAGAIPTNGGLHCVFASMPPARYRECVRLDPVAGLRVALAEADPALAAEVAAGRIATRPSGFAGERGYQRQSHGPGWALVGDAAYFKDPITAHGITDALRDAEILAGAIKEGGAAAFARQQETRDALSLPLFRVSEAIAAFDWTLPRVQDLHHELNRAMKAEQDWLSGYGLGERAA